MRFSKLLVGFSITSLLLLGLGCKNSTPAVGGTNTQRKTLELWTVYDDVDALNAVITNYKAARPYLAVNIRQLRPEDLYNRLVETLAEDRGPDIISIDNRSLGKYVSKLTTLPPSVQDTTVKVIEGQFSTQTVVSTKTIPTVTLDQLDREYIPVVKQDVIRGGRIYGLPISMDTMAIYYNKDLLDRAGIAEPPKTWEEFQEAVRKLTKFDRVSGKIVQSGAALGAAGNVPWNDDLLYILFKQSNITFVDRSGRAVFNGASNSREETPTMQVMSFYTDFADPTRDTYSWNEEMPNALDGFVTGKIAFFFGYQFHNQTIKARAPQLNYVIIPLLQLKPDLQANVANYSILTVPAKSKQANEAWALVAHLTHSAATKDYLDRSGRLTALRAYINAQKENIVLAPFVADLLVATSWYRGNNYEVAAGAVKDMIREWLRAPANVENLGQYRQSVLNRAAARINQTL
ncbi:MAG: hypothetical protein A3I29_01470 [Candidatus Magasanikbacteria bacterium RIFCSPLOWO2_02_FULL_44_11]|uniref:ABC transporter substrate-binding protein n=2 Tax=Candidatus Magasanikiibacteriota TaxID=1752731 RepID=A0A1F6N9F9_9BACT|nr:MAG: hypothetical protein A3D53_00580 [Candidatus Magasanikbacteria bacterium RIFCSPHIGHO2_02_FULL_45_10]OGH80350.1 MAG: hypothetical protein A3I29_01470 [Candidatus Magasanikbacteria bacterium RIFCSPLOWO2_02_FULL_44_11]